MSDFDFTIPETDSMVDIEEYLNYLLIERCNEIHSKIILTDSEYQNLQTRIERWVQELLGVLPEPLQTEMVTETLWSITGTLETILPRLTYRQAFKDGVQFNGYVKRKSESEQGSK